MKRKVSGEKGTRARTRVGRGGEWRSDIPGAMDAVADACDGTVVVLVDSLPAGLAVPVFCFQAKFMQLHMYTCEGEQGPQRRGSGFRR